MDWAWNDLELDCDKFSPALYCCTFYTMYTHGGLIRYAAFTSLLRHDEFPDKHLGVADVQAS